MRRKSIKQASRVFDAGAFFIAVRPLNNLRAWRVRVTAGVAVMGMRP